MFCSYSITIDYPYNVLQRTSKLTDLLNYIFNYSHPHTERHIDSYFVVSELLENSDNSPTTM